MSKLFVLKIKRELCLEIINDGIVDKYRVSFDLGSSAEEDYFPCFIETTFFDGSNNSIFALSICQPNDMGLLRKSEPGFDTEYFKNRVNNFANNVNEHSGISFVKLDSTVLLQFIEQFIRYERNNHLIRCVPRNQFKILKIGFLGTLDKDLRCVVILSKKKEIETDLTIEEVDKMVDYTDCSYNSIVPVRLDKYLKDKNKKK